MLWRVAAGLLLVSCGWGQTSAQSQSKPQPHSPERLATSGTATRWQYSFTMDGYLIEGEDGYAQPSFTADHHWLHFEARYNYENLHTGSLWVGYNFAWGKTWQFYVTPMIGGVFGRTSGIAPGCEASLTWKKLTLSLDNEYVFDTTSKSGNFYYSWPQLTYQPVGWLRVGGVVQHTKAFQTEFDAQRGFLIGVNWKKLEITTYVFNPGTSSSSVVPEVAVSF